MRERRIARVFAAAVGVGVLMSSQVASASFSDGASAGASYASALLQPPTAPAAAAGTCSTVTGDRTVLTWTAATSTWASGYEIARATTSGGPYTVIATVTGASTTTYTDAPPAFSTTYYYAIRSMKYAWRSSDATVSRTTRNTLCV